LSVMEDKEAEEKKTSATEEKAREAPPEEAEKAPKESVEEPKGGKAKKKEEKKTRGTRKSTAGKGTSRKKKETEVAEEAKVEAAALPKEGEKEGEEPQPEEKKETKTKRGRGRKKAEKTTKEAPEKVAEEPGEEKAEKKAPVEKPEEASEKKEKVAKKPKEEEKPEAKKKARGKRKPKEEKVEEAERPKEDLKAAPPVIEEPGIKIPKEFYMVFGKYPIDGVVVRDAGLAKYIILKPALVHHTHGRHANRAFQKANLTIVERLINNMMRTEKYTGKKSKAYKVVRETFEIIEKRTKKNPLQVLADALVNSAPREEVTRLKFGGISVPKAVDVSPSRRLDIALRNICKGAVKMTFKNRKPVAECLATEIILASQEDVNSYAISKKEEVERIAASAR